MINLAIVVSLGAALAACSSQALPDSSPAPSHARESLARTELNKEWAKFASVYPDAHRPKVDRIRFVALVDWPDTFGRCLTEFGFAATITPDGGVTYSGNVAQQQAFDLAGFECRSMYPVDPESSIPLDGERLSSLYDDYLNRLVPCLEKRGVVVPEPPTRQLFIESYYSGNGWEPYANTSDLPQDQWYKLNKDCPQTPPGF
ncbi:hypothetical protein QMG61_04650 [Cryobacterium sp. PH31-AA6]|uniref:hypothetical protein n=1 Tax=Cryobacterium sp. PH31-AA6 TaxID=3046205 RepID=UPI0024B91F9F|nr:hypothetical protein [Cryobacterium sp. PH31-AA6]MDJ0323053.1 hypothetical protein [Cryobacterium sp. PH31-AA6]